MTPEYGPDNNWIELTLVALALLILFIAVLL